VHVLLDRRYLAALDGVSDIRKRGRLMRYESSDHQGKNRRVDFEKQASQRRDAHLGEHQEMHKRFLRACLVLDIARAMTRPIGKADADPDRHDEILEHAAGGGGGHAL